MLGSVVMFISAGVNAYVSSRLYKVSKETDSIALEADALHLKTDVYTSLGVAAGLVFILITGLHIFDAFIAIAVAIVILRESWALLKKAYSPLLDSSLNKGDLETIEATLRKMNVKYHQLKSRKSGHLRFVEFHIELPSEKSLQDVHDFCDDIERELTMKLRNLDVQIHAEPLNYHSEK